MGKYLSILGLFVIGVVIVISGIYYFITYSAMAESFEYQLGIALMLFGLLVTGVGAIRGKRTMRSVGYFAEYPDSRKKPGKPSPMQAPSKPSQPAKSSPVKQAPAKQSPAESKTAAPAASQPPPSAPLTTPAAPPVPSTPSRPTPTAPATGAKAPPAAQPPKDAPKVVKVLVCPKCGSENQVTDMFCFNCGKKLRPKTKAKKK